MFMVNVNSGFFWVEIELFIIFIVKVHTLWSILADSSAENLSVVNKSGHILNHTPIAPCLPPLLYFTGWELTKTSDVYTAEHFYPVGVKSVARLNESNKWIECITQTWHPPQSTTMRRDALQQRIIFFPIFMGDNGCVIMIKWSETWLGLAGVSWFMDSRQ